MASFLANLFSNHGKKIIREVSDAVVALDPATATAAQLATMEQSLDATGKILAGIRADTAREQSEASEIQVRFGRQKAAAAALSASVDAETDPAIKAKKTESLNNLLTALEKLKGEVETEVNEAKDALALLTETEAQYNEKAAALRTAKKDLTDASRDLERANIAKQRAEATAETAAQLAGLRDNDVTSLNSAMSAMQRKAADARKDADAAKSKAAALSVKDTGTEDDPFVAEALAQVDGSTNNKSAAERLAALS